MKTFVSILLAALFAPAVLADGPILYDRPRQLGRMVNPDITESSGLAWSNANENVLWTHNDKGNKPRLFAVALDGTHVGEFKVDAKHTDWEDMCTFKTDRDSYILLADVGDNDAKRKSYTLYLMREPKLKKSPKFGKMETIKPQAEVEFTYEGGPFNCEAVGVDATDPRALKVLLVTKDDRTCKVFEMKLPLRPEKNPMVAKEIASLRIAKVTGMDISPDGTRAIVLTYGDAYEFTRETGKTWADAFSGKPRVLPMPLRRQGETICYGGDGITLYLTSEGGIAPIWSVPPRPTE